MAEGGETELDPTTPTQLTGTLDTVLKDSTESEIEFSNLVGETVVKRVRVLTNKGQEAYEDIRNGFIRKLDIAWRKVEDVLIECDKCSDDIRKLRSTAELLRKNSEAYLTLSEDYVDFLNRTYSENSLEELQRFSTIRLKYKTTIERVLEELEDIKQNMLEKFSVTSSKASTRASEATVVSVKRRAIADAHRARVQFVEKEAYLQKQKASIEADLYLIRVQKEAAAADAKAQVYEAHERDSRGSLANLVEPIDTRARTQEYVATQNSIIQDHIVQSPSTHVMPAPSAGHVVQSPPPSVPPWNAGQLPPPQIQPQPSSSVVFNPQPTSHTVTSNVHELVDSNVASELSRFLLKKELLFSRISPFSDRPELYPSWKASFRNVVTEIRVSACEETDLLLKWTGPQSKLHVESIRAANAHQPEVGLRRIWERLDERYGSPELIERALKEKLSSFPRLTNKDTSRLFDLADVLDEIASLKANPAYSSVLAYFDSSIGVSPIVSKLPYDIQGKWTTRASRYKKDNNVYFPQFDFFVEFVHEMSRVKNDPSFKYDNAAPVQPRPVTTQKLPRTFQGGSKVTAMKTNADSHMSYAYGNVTRASTPRTASSDTTSGTLCFFHKSSKHSLNQCKQFRSLPWDQRKQFLKENSICFKCCESRFHISKDCKVKVTCGECDKTGHATAMHIDRKTSSDSPKADGGESQRFDNSQAKQRVQLPNTLTSKCTEVCSSDFNGRSCAKVVLVNAFPFGQPEKAVKLYAVIDDQSNRSLGTSTLFDQLNLTSERFSYSLLSCAGTFNMSGRKTNDLVVQSLDKTVNIVIPTVIEREEIPDDRSEIPTPEVAALHPHLVQIAANIPPLDENANIQLLIGRDVPEAHIVQKQIVGPLKAPFAQKLALGWVIVGDVCLGKFHTPTSVSVKKTRILKGGRGTIFDPCQNHINIKETLNAKTCFEDMSHDSVAENIFVRNKDDEKVAYSIEDKQFISLMENAMHRKESGHWEAPLPFKKPISSLGTVIPNNRSMAFKRAMSLDASLKKDPIKCEHFVTFMQRVLSSGAAEVAPEVCGDEVNYLPIFGVYHPKKPNQIRGVFDSSAVFDGVSLNSLLMTGPDLTNSLLEILLRFRMNKIAISADVEQMFYQFYVNEDHRDYLRFFWYKDNDPTKQIIEYRMCVHVFGNSPSPAIATFGLRKCVENSNEDVKNFVNKNFYVDDALTSVNDTRTAVELLNQTRNDLSSNGKVRLHKIASNDRELLKTFPTQELSADLRDLDLNDNDQKLPCVSSLGIPWNLDKDCFVLNMSDVQKPFTRRGLLSFLNGIFDPMGFISPIVIGGKILLREMMTKGIDWDELLPLSSLSEWESWKNSLYSISGLEIPRMFVSLSVSEAKTVGLHVFCDASEKAIAAVCYMVCTDCHGNRSQGFVMGKTKLAPVSGHTIPRLELCAAVLATELCETVRNSLHVEPDVVKYYTDSKVVLGYLNNTTRRFYTYVANRVDKIRQYSDPCQWQYIATSKNPADLGTRLSLPKDCITTWLHGPSDLTTGIQTNQSDFHLQDPDSDLEIRPEVSVSKTSIQPSDITQRFERFSSWNSLISALSVIRRKILAHNGRTRENLAQEREKTATFVIKSVQSNAYEDEIEFLSQGRNLPRSSVIRDLNPFLDDFGILRVGGRLKNCPLNRVVSHPIILPKNSHVSKLIVVDVHENVRHQGRLFTEGALKEKGYWIVSAKRLVSSIIHDCVVCRKLRAPLAFQQMANLPEDRVTPGPPFTSVGVDVFGPWTVLTRKTRGGSAQSKRWAVLFTCLTTRAVHIELIEEMSSSSFINALRRFISIRGSVKVFRSDRGTNFVGATDSLGVNAVYVEKGPVGNYLRKNGTTWIFNPPHASHFGGIWERMIGIARSILDAMFLESKGKQLTHEVLVTFMAEVTAIMNSRPITGVTTDPDDTLILSPNFLLTQKQGFDPIPITSTGLKDIYVAQWKHVQYLSNVFWKKWRDQYLSQLQQRRKWQTVQPNVKVGDVILLRDKSLPRFSWPLGLVTSVHPSESDGHVRSVDIKVFDTKEKSVTYTRPVSELILLID